VRLARRQGGVEARVMVGRRSIAKFVGRTRRAARAKVTRHLFVDVGRDPSRAVILLGSARSGTTKLARVLTSSPRTRLILEPLNKFESPIGGDFAWGTYRGPDSTDPALERFWRRALTGALRSEWTDVHNRTRFATRRVVKCIAGTNLAPWLRSRFPDTPIVYIVRDPIATAKSIEALHEQGVARGITEHWGPLQGQAVDEAVQRSGLLDGPLQHAAAAITSVWRDADTTFERCVLRWGLENYVALTDPPPSGVQLIWFEDLFENPNRHVADLAAFTGLDLERGLADIAEPSKTDWNRKPGEQRSWSDRRDGWRATVTSTQHKQARRILKVFGLDELADGPVLKKPMAGSPWIERH